MEQVCDDPLWTTLERLKTNGKVVSIITALPPSMSYGGAKQAAFAFT
jgi:hypothetical protein